MQDEIYRFIENTADEMYEETVKFRRDFHTYPEPGWAEVRTSSLIAKRLTELGYRVLTGDEVCERSAMMGLLSEETFAEEYERAVAEGADMEFAPKMKNGYTGVIGILENGEGPVVALRFDIDALYMTENHTEDHRPYREGFASKNIPYMHACGHDGHAAMGLGVAKILMQIRDKLHGTVRLIFQPAEEGVRGAKAIVAHGHLDGVDYLLGSHISPIEGFNGDIVPGAYGSLATTKMDVEFYGKAAHAGSAPEKGKNVMLGVATAISNLYGIPRNGEGASRINVGSVRAGSGRNVIADYAKMQIEVRGETSEINEYMEEYAKRIIKAAAQMHDLKEKITLMGSAITIQSDEELVQRVRKNCEKNLKTVKLSDKDYMHLGGSEDFSFMLKRVQDNGGQATFLRVLSPLGDVPHGTGFDFDERCLTAGIKVFAASVYDLMK